MPGMRSRFIAGGDELLELAQAFGVRVCGLRRAGGVEDCAHAPRGTQTPPHSRTAATSEASEIFLTPNIL